MYLGIALPLSVKAQFVDFGASLTGVGDASIDWADYDGDNDPDLLIAGQSSDGLFTRLYRNDAGSFTVVPNTPFIPISLGKVLFGDYDGDQDPDLLLTGQQQRRKRHHPDLPKQQWHVCRYKRWHNGVESRQWPAGVILMEMAT